MKRTLASLVRLTMAKKLLIGFLSCAILTILIDFIAFSCLQRLNEIHKLIIERDVPLKEITDKMIEVLLTQDLYGRRSLILKRPEVEALFWKRSEEFKMFLKDIGNLPDASSLPLVSLSVLHEAYNHFFFHYDETPLVVVNTEAVDFVHNQGDLDNIISVVRNPPKGTVYFNPTK